MVSTFWNQYLESTSGINTRNATSGINIRNPRPKSNIHYRSPFAQNSIRIRCPGSASGIRNKYSKWKVGIRNPFQSSVSDMWDTKTDIRHLAHGIDTHSLHLGVTSAYNMKSTGLSEPAYCKSRAAVSFGRSNLP